MFFRLLWGFEFIGMGEKNEEVENMKLSHILYRVDNLHKAVEDFKNMGFTVVYGTKPEKAFNALIWFEKGPFIELYQINKNKFIINAMKLLGKKGLANRFSHFQNSNYGWVDYSIENDRRDLTEENLLLKEMGYKFSTMPGFRTDINGNKLKWKLSIPFDSSFPFLMSAYSINPRPRRIKHINGAKEVKRLIWGTDKKNIPNINRLLNDNILQLIEGHGFQKIIIDGWDEETFNKPYYK